MADVAGAHRGRPSRAGSAGGPAPVPPIEQFALTAAQIADPYPVYRRYRDLDPVHRVAAGTSQGVDTWYVFGYDDVVSVLGRPGFGRRAASGPDGASPVTAIPHRFGTLRGIVADWLVFLDPPRHTRLRSAVADRFTAGMVAGLRPRIEDLAAALVAPLRARDTVDLVDTFAAPLPILVICELLGIRTADRDWIRRCAVALQEANSSRGGDPDGRFARAENAAHDLARFFAEEIAQRRRRPRDDIISRLLTVEAPPVRPAGPDERATLTDDEIVSTSIHLLTAGHETTTNLISKAVLALLAHPPVREELRSAPELMPAAVDEFIRYDAPVQMVSRRAQRPETVAGNEIPPGSRVVLVLGSANRDPGRFTDPDSLDIHRVASRHCGFGIGIHYCLGAALARVEAQIGIATLLRDLPDLRLAGEPVQYADDMVFHGPARLPLRTRASAAGGR